MDEYKNFMEGIEQKLKGGKATTDLFVGFRVFKYKDGDKIRLLKIGGIK